MITLTNTSKLLEEIDSSITEVLKAKHSYRFFGKRGSAASRSYLVSEVFYHLLGGETSALRVMNVESHWWVEDKRGQIYEIPPNNIGEEISRDKAAQDMRIRFKKPSWRASRIIKHLLSNIG